MAATYCTVADVRLYTHITSTEWSDADLTDLIERIQGEIDFQTGRTWQGVQTATNEYYDGTGCDVLFLKNTDIASVTAISIDDDGDGTYTSLTVATDIHVYSEGIIKINKQKSSITSFTRYPRAVKVTYTYGTATVAPIVNHLALLMVVNHMQPDPNRKRMIDQITNRLAFHSPLGLV
jgi:hypothetical protein